MLKVSVIVPICNVEKYLEQCLMSLSAQTLQEMEIICINDGSKDGSSAIAHKFAAKDVRFRVIDKENSGYGKTMNLGLSLAQGKYVGIVESDDFVEPDMFSYLYEQAVKHQADVVKSAFWAHTNGLDVMQPFISDEWTERVISNRDTFEVFEHNPSIWSNLYKRDFLKANNINFSETPGASFQDIAWRVKVFACAKKCLFTKKAFYHYRRDNENASVRTNGKVFCVCDEYDEVERFLSPNSEWENKYKYLIPFLRWGHYKWNFFDRWLSANSRWKFYKRMNEEMLEYEEQGLLKRSFWRPGQWKYLQNMLADSRQFFFDHYVLILRKMIVLHGVIFLLEESPKIAVYGAGKVGREALAALCLYGKRPDCFVVSDMQDNESSVEDVAVHSVDELMPKKEDYVILIATGMGTQPEILELLLEKGFKNIILFLPEVRQVLHV